MHIDILGVYFMKKKLKLVMFAMCVMLPVTSILTACDNHEHIMDSAWASDANCHWHECMMDNCDVVSGKDAHTFGDWIVDEVATPESEGQKHRKCSTCYYYEYAVVPIPDSEGLEFKLNADGQSYGLMGMGTCSDEVVVVPRAYEGKPVTSVLSPDYYTNNTNSVKKIILPDTITTLANRAFAKYAKLEQITLPNSITSVGEDTFNSCRALKSVTLSTSMDSIAENMFYCCKSLESISIPNNIKSIGASAFYGTGLKSIVVPNSVETIGGCAFKDCDNLSNISLSSELEIINENTFNNCVSLKSINIPDSVTQVYFNAFYKCTSLETVNVGKNTQFIIPNSDFARSFNHFNECVALQAFTVNAENPYYKVVDGSLYSVDGKILYVYAHGKNDTTFTVPNGVERIEDNAFLKSNNLISVILPDSVKYIGLYAFKDCENLESISIGTGVEVIGLDAFAYNDKLKTITYTGTEAQWDAIVKGKHPDYPENEYEMGTDVTPFPSLNAGDGDDIEE